MMPASDSKTVKSEKPFSPSCERNKRPILEVLKKEIGPQYRRLLEVGAGTGQHAHYFSSFFKSLDWQTSDVKANHPAIEMWTGRRPFSYQIGKDDFPSGNFDLIYTANSLHIMSFDLVKVFISDIGKLTSPPQKILLYGPFNYKGKFTSESNAKFELWLKDRDPLSGIRDFEKIQELMNSISYELHHDYEMPANNRLLVFKRKEKR